MTELTVFNNADFGSIRAMEIDGEPWFVGKDVAERLGYKETAKAIREHVDPEDKGVSEMDTPGGKQPMTVVNESGLYSLVLSSKLPGAKAFKRWVTSEVIPAIRKHGGYLTPEKTEEILLNPDTIITLAQQLKAERERRRELESAVGAKDQQIAEMTPKAGYYDLILQNKDALAISKIAKDYGLSGVALNKILHDAHIQYKQGDVWLLYQKYAAQGYTATRTDLFTDAEGSQHVKVRTCWTQKGRLFIYDLLKSRGILPAYRAGRKRG